MGVMEQQVATRSPLIALLGNPNCGKTALFNRLTGARQKVANYAGVTIERKEGSFTSPAGRALRVLDLPGAYSLSAQTPTKPSRATSSPACAPVKRRRMPSSVSSTPQTCA